MIPASQLLGNTSGFLNNDTSHGCLTDSYWIGWNSGYMLKISVAVQLNNCVSVKVVNCLLFLVIPIY